MVLEAPSKRRKGGRKGGWPEGVIQATVTGKGGEEEEEEEEIGMAMLVRVSGGVYGSEKSAILL